MHLFFFVSIGTYVLSRLGGKYATRKTGADARHHRRVFCSCLLKVILHRKAQNHLIVIPYIPSLYLMAVLLLSPNFHYFHTHHLYINMYCFCDVLLLYCVRNDPLLNTLTSFPFKLFWEEMSNLFA